MIFRGRVRDDEAYRDTIEKSPFAEIIADAKNELVSSGEHFLACEERRVDAAVIVCLHSFDQARGIGRPKFDGHAARRTAACRVQHMCGERTHLRSARALACCSRRLRGELSIAMLAQFGEGAELSTRGACAPRNSASHAFIRSNRLDAVQRF